MRRQATAKGSRPAITMAVAALPERQLLRSASLCSTAGRSGWSFGKRTCGVSAFWRDIEGSGWLADRWFAVTVNGGGCSAVANRW